MVRNVDGNYRFSLDLFNNLQSFTTRTIHNTPTHSIQNNIIKQELCLPVHVLLEQVHSQVHLCLGSEPTNTEAQRRMRHLVIRACLVSIVWSDFIWGKYCVTLCESIEGI